MYRNNNINNNKQQDKMLHTIIFLLVYVVIIVDIQMVARCQASGLPAGGGSNSVCMLATY